jgi:signal transduction histidine kinase
LELEWNIFASSLALTGIFNAFIAIIVLQKTGGATKWFGALMLSVSIWACTYAIELASLNLPSMLWCIKVEYIGIAFIPACWIIFVIKFIGNDHWLNAKKYILIFCQPIITLILVWTNAMHHLHYAEVGFNTEGPFPLLAFKPGIWYHIHTVFFYSMLAIGNYLLLRAYSKENNLYNTQYKVIVAASFIPWITNMMYLIGWRPYEIIDLTPYAFIFTAIIIGLGFIRYNLFMLLPIARERIVETMVDGILITDKHFLVIDINSSMRTILFNMGKAFKPGSPIEELFQSAPEIKQWLTSNSNLNIEFTYHNTIFEIHKNHLKNPDQSTKGYTYIFKDITVIKHATEQLRNQASQLKALNEQKDKLFSIIAHDLRSPLAGLVSLLTLNRNQKLDPEKFNKFIDMLSKDVMYTSSLLDNLLQWAGSQLKGTNLFIEPFLLKPLLLGELSHLGQLANLKNISIKDTTPDSLVIEADKEMLRVVFRNIISNAIKFSYEGGEIIIGYTKQDSWHIFTITDFGVGIESEKAAQLFSYKTLSTRGTSNEKGTGIGLLLCYELITQHGGKIEVKSSYGKGTTFEFALPIK